MAQHDYIISNATFPAIRTDLNNALSAIQTTNSGTSRPTGAVAGQLWLDTTTATSPTLKYYDGADDISLATIDHTANTVNWLDSTVSITGLSTTATGTVLTLSDSANITTVNLIIDNQKEIRFRETTANGTNYVALKAPASVSADLTFTLPATDGTNGQALITNGSGVLSFTTIVADGTADWDTSVKTTGFTATANKAYFCNTTSAGFTVTLPATPSAGDEVVVLDYAGTFDTNALTISPNGNKIEAGTASLQLKGEREGARLVYIDTTQGWLAYSGINEGTDALEPQIITADYLIIAGGGGAGGNAGPGSGWAGGGGGAGGYRSFTSQTLTPATNYTVTVGAGGAGGPNNNSGSQGGTSTFSTINSAGGGFGGGGVSDVPLVAGGNGGSGGGGKGSTSGNSAGGSGNTPSTSPSQGNNGGPSTSSTNNPGSGGGAGAVGNPGNSGGSPTAGGAGVANSITGSSVTYSVGGGAQQTSGGAGTANRGNGGDARNGDGVSGYAGGSGIVIIKYQDTFTISNPGGGLTYSTASAGGFKVTSFTAGTGTIQLN
jgi:hypothetical protein